MNYHKKWKSFLKEAPRDAKVLRNINIDFIKKDEPKDPEEEIRDYFARIQQMERDPEYLNPVFPQGLVDWVESLPDNHFPRNGRKRFAKWLGNTIYYQETEVQGRLHTVDDPEELRIYNNDVRYIVDYLNGADEFPDDLWDRSLNGMYDLAVEWHDTLKYKEDPTGDYEHKNVVYKFSDGFTIVDVKTENDLKVEGELMGHCVGSYCDSVASGNTEIYSLRDPKNRPHVTIEVSYGRVEQIKGKGNDTPAEKYRPMIKQWLPTTDLDYKDSSDYSAILTKEEIIQQISDGDVSRDFLYRIARFTKDSEIIDLLINISEDPTIAAIEKIDHFHPAALLSLVADNNFIDKDQVLRVLEINLEKKVLGSRVEDLFYDPVVELGERKPGGRDLAPTVWDRFKHKLTEDLNDEKLHYMAAIVGRSGNEPLNREIVEFLLSDETVTGLLHPHSGKAKYGQSDALYSNILQDYVKERPLVAGRDGENYVPDSQMLEKIYDFVKSKQGDALLGSYEFRILSSIASSSAITARVVEGIIKTVKSEPTTSFAVPGGTISSAAFTLLENPAVEDSYRYWIFKDIIAPRFETSRSAFPVMFAERIVTKYDLYSLKFLKHLADGGYLDPYFKKEADRDYLSRTGQYPHVADPKVQARIEKLQKTKREEWMKEKLENSESYSTTVQEQIEDYFLKFSAKKEPIKEEIGRSRQRGIYKFYCMLSYALTVEDRKSRGLDDILADLRALPNVTIVTVVIRNQKVAEQRYIAGLSVKFIPSVPGEFNSPEDVKVRIIKDIRRLGNVNSIFKISSGLERIE